MFLNQKHSLSAAFNYTISSNLKISFGGIVRSGKPYTKPVNGYETKLKGNRTVINYDKTNNERLSNFFKLDFSSSYKFNFSNTIKSTIRIAFTNITNKRNIIDSYYILDNNNANRVKRVNNFSLAFTPNLSFRIKF